MRLVLLSLLMFISISLESTFLQLPLVLILLFVFTIIFQSAWVFPSAFAAGILLDALTFRNIGNSSLFFILFIFLVFLYEKKFELRSVWFVIMMSCAGSFGFLVLFGYQMLAAQLFTSVVLTLILFYIFSYIFPLPPSDTVSTWKQ